MADLRKKIEEMRGEAAGLKKDLATAEAMRGRSESSADEVKRETESIKQQLERALVHKTKSQEQVRKLAASVDRLRSPPPSVGARGPRRPDRLRSRGRPLSRAT